MSGAHINPVVTLAFWLRGKFEAAVALGYIAAQAVGGTAGAVALRIWGPLGRSVAFAATTPGAAGDLAALAGEAAATAALIGGLFAFLGHDRLKRFTPALFAPLYGLMVLVEAPLSGTSTNPARSLGPALVAHTLGTYWLYVAGPVAGTLAVALIWHLTPPLRRLEIDVAKLYHFHHDPYGLFSRRRPRHRSGAAPHHQGG